MKKVIFFLSLSFLSFQGKGSHIVGGEFTYKCIGANTYQFTLYMYRDCLNGTPTALLNDDPAYIAIFAGSTKISFDSIPADESITIPANFSNACLNNPPNTCLNRIRFRFTKVLPPNAIGYTAVCQRCCRNNSITNILNPGTTGASYFCKIPPSPTICNNSAQFKNYPPQIICANNPFVYDNSATDADGDSLSYEFCNAFIGGSDVDPKPDNGSITAPPYSIVNYRSPYNSLNPMGGNPILTINPITGIITGKPNIQGRFVVNVCCSEWRGGIKINTVQREFQFVVTNCTKAVVADIPQLSLEANTYIVLCNGFTANFLNDSKGGSTYHWDFGVTTSLTDTSNLFSPTFTFPDTGIYIVKLWVNPNTTCSDSITRLVKVYPYFNADYNYDGLHCPYMPIQFIDKSTSTFPNIDYWQWDFNDGTIDNTSNPIHVFPNTGQNFGITLVSGNSKGCRDTITKSILIPLVKINAGNDTIIVKNNSIQYQATGGVLYEWTPSTNLNFTNISNPIGFYADTGHYTYIVKGTTTEQCIGYDTIRVIVSNGPYIYVPNAFSPNGDGLNDFLKAFASGYKKLNYFRIFNRWGQMVFQTSDFRNGWNGEYKRKECEIGSYYWMASAIALDGNEKIVKGDVTLLR